MVGSRKPGVPPEAPASLSKAFDLTGRVAVITGGAGLLGAKHAEAVIELGGVPVLLDIDGRRAASEAARISSRFNREALGLSCSITDPAAIEAALNTVLMP